MRFAALDPAAGSGVSGRRCLLSFKGRVYTCSVTLPAVMYTFSTVFQR